jgi:hypothetical protein
MAAESAQARTAGDDLTLWSLRKRRLGAGLLAALVGFVVSRPRRPA